MSTLQSLYCDLQCCIISISFYFFVFQISSNVYTTCTTDNKLTPSLRVEVKQYVRVESVCRKTFCAKHTCLFICCDKSLDRTMLQSLVFHNCHDSCYSDTIVGTKSCTLSFHPFAIDIGLDRVSLKIVGAVHSLLWHHIHVSLQQDSLAILHSWSSRLLHYNVFSLVFEYFNTYFLTEVEQELLYFLKVSRWTWHLGQRIKVAPNALRF